jgi:hypothetical protein
MPNRIKTTLGGPRPYKNSIGRKKISGTQVLAFPPQCWQQVLMLKPFFFITDAPKNNLRYSTFREGSQNYMQTYHQPVKLFSDKCSSFSASKLATGINVKPYFLHH